MVQLQERVLEGCRMEYAELCARCGLWIAEDSAFITGVVRQNVLQTAEVQCRSKVQVEELQEWILVVTHQHWFHFRPRNLWKR
eukprot:TRINITY_DN3428_c0_g1_i1.p2 TRINITY_DN3428_c0_g1~~TRINITY_DN3428_c0_g1_i1.p2  ORF type:complete len:83 (+),score=9.13 TRINITY_DN3428_c0_g1_i1:87-335(+)